MIVALESIVMSLINNLLYFCYYCDITGAGMGTHICSRQE